MKKFLKINGFSLISTLIGMTISLISVVAMMVVYKYSVKTVFNSETGTIISAKRRTQVNTSLLMTQLKIQNAGFGINGLNKDTNFRLYKGAIMTIGDKTENGTEITFNEDKIQQILNDKDTIAKNDLIKADCDGPEIDNICNLVMWETMPYVDDVNITNQTKKECNALYFNANENNKAVYFLSSPVEYKTDGSGYECAGLATAINTMNWKSISKLVDEKVIKPDSNLTDNSLENKMYFSMYNSDIKTETAKCTPLGQGVTTALKGGIEFSMFYEEVNSDTNTKVENRYDVCLINFAAF